MRFKSKYSIMLYQYLKNWQNAEKAQENERVCYISVDELKKLFGIGPDEYQRNLKGRKVFFMSAFKSRTLDVAIEEINNNPNCDMQILECSNVKDGRTIIKFKFHYAMAEES
jgi:plasmid replication initiation protein